MSKSASLRLRLALVTGLLGLAAALAASLLAHHQARQRIEAEQHRLLTQIALGLAGQLAQDLHARGSELAMLAELDVLRDPATPADMQRRVLESAQRSHPALAWIGLAGPDGTVLADTGGRLAGTSVSQRPWFVPGQQGLHYGQVSDVGDVDEARPPARQVLPTPMDAGSARLLDIAVPVRSPDGQTAGVLAAQLNLAWVAQAHQRASERLAGDGITLMVLDPRNRLLVGGPLGSLFSSTATTAIATPHARALRHGEEPQRARLAVAVRDSGHGRYPGLGWQMVASTDEARAYGPADRLAAATLALGSLAALLAAVWMWAVLGRLLKPLAQVGAAAARLRAIRHDDHDAGAPAPCMAVPPGQDEVALHVRSLADLVNHLLQLNLGLQLGSRAFEACSQAIAVCSAQGRVLQVNPAFESLTGHPPDQAVGQPATTLLGRGLDTVASRRLADSLRAPGDWSGELDLRRVDGRPCVGWMEAHALHDAQGRISHRILVIRDITEQQRDAQAQARQRDQLTQRLAERTAALQWASDALLEARKVAQAAQAGPGVVAAAERLAADPDAAPARTPVPAAPRPQAARPSAPLVLAAHGDAEHMLRQRHGLRVLLAEDNAVNQEVASALLQSVGVEVVVVDDGEAAVAQLSRQRFDLVLMDMEMPVMDGLAATRHIRQLPHGATVPILAMTAHAFTESSRACLDAGMNGHVSKPVEPETLFATLLRWLPDDGTPAMPSEPAAPPLAVTEPA